ncbi:hypothetical protein OQE61_12785 [Cetobacterium somerae]|uniref:hypothetical protein n=2 Tax=Cetobacterium TaxID=180162 RepID=UPI00225A7742|nr:hypothetical protein [Cetobacterium somerae]MCX3068372.1 hypothetical protein [Cetobacterium somerae]
MNNKLIQVIEIGAKTYLSTIPIGGTLITSVWDSVKNNKIETRQNEWKNMIENKLSSLEISLEDIGNNDKFTTCILKATELAIKTSSIEKKLYLANALINSINIDFDETTMLIFLNLIEEYTDLHMIILDFFSNPLKFSSVKNSNLYMGSPMKLFYDEYPNFKAKENLISLINNKLYLDGLLSSNSLNTTMTSDGAKGKQTTDLGDQFLEFFK